MEDNLCKKRGWMDETKTVTTERGSVSVAGRLLGSCAFVCALMLGAPQPAWSLAADGVLLTNTVAATYHGLAGYPDGGCPTCPRYVVSYLASANILISCPVVSLLKTAVPTVEGAGGTVIYRLWAVNDSLEASAFNFTMTDVLPPYMSFVAMNPSWPGLPWVTSSSVDGSTYTPGAPAAGQGGQYYLRWTIDELGPGMSAYVEFQAVIL